MKTFEEWCKDKELKELSKKESTIAYQLWGKACFREGKEVEAKNADLRERLDKAEQRVQVAERALLTACVNLIKDEKDNVNMELLARVVYTNYLRKAEKELAEEKNEQV